MSGIQTENASDVGGGQDVGWQDTGDWMDYAVNVSSAGTYTANFRVASMFTGAQFQVRNSAGTVLATITVPNTGSFQTWQTISASITLPAGQQTLRIYTSNASGGWNINWWEIMAQGSAGSTVKTASLGDASVVSTTEPLQVFPNPVQDHFSLKVDNSLSGKVSVSIINTQGQTLKQFSLTKASEGPTQWYLSIGSLPSGNYILQVTMSNWNQSVKISKE
jgi:endoglucanase